MFTGEYRHNLDNKGRVILPIKFRQGDEPIKTFVLTVGLDHCIAAYPQEIWDSQVQEELNKVEWNDASGRALLRQMYANATASEPDRQGRIFVPQTLRKYASIEKDVVIIGMNRHIEIWDRERWEQHAAGAQQLLAEHAGKLASYKKTG